VVTGDPHGIGGGRPRPPYTPQKISCGGCGAGVEIRDERAQQLICPYCRAVLELSGQEQLVLGISPGGDAGFQLPLGQGFQWQGARYEVIARVALIEDGTLEEMTHEYYLYHPRRRALTLSEYDGEFSLSWASRVMPPPDSFYMQHEGSQLTTGDGEKWICEGRGTYEVYYIDGALPYRLSVKDQIDYAEFRGATRAGEQYEIQQASNGETEFGRGRSLSVAQVNRALGKKVRGFQGGGGDDGWVKKWAWGLALLCLITLLANVGIFMDVIAQGSLVLTEDVNPQQLQAEHMTQPFTVGHDGDLIQVKLAASVENAWLSANLAVVEADGDTVVHVFENDVSYYHGYEGGERWSEGSRTDDVYIQIEEAGNYRVLVGAVCGQGASNAAGPCYQAARLWVKRGVLVPHYSVTALILSFLCFVCALVAIKVNTGKSRPRDNPTRLLLKGRYVWAAVALATVLLSAVPTYARWGAQEMEHPDGLSIRQASAQTPVGARRGFFIFYNSPRRHLGGGIGAGK